jgi:hypothetical protein
MSCATPAMAILSSSPTMRAISGSSNAAQPLHAGLVILIPVVSRGVQRRLFKAALDELAMIGEPGNRALEVDLDGDEVMLTLYDWPPPRSSRPRVAYHNSTCMKPQPALYAIIPASTTRVVSG